MVAQYKKNSDFLVHAFLEGTVNPWPYFQAQAKFQTSLDSYISSQTQHIKSLYCVCVRGKAPSHQVMCKVQGGSLVMFVVRSGAASKFSTKIRSLVEHPLH
jgi:hypothetical protein